MDTLKLNIVMCNEFQGILDYPTNTNVTTIKTYDVEVILNSVTLPHDIFNLVVVLPAFKFNNTKFDMFTCSCGVAGCAGFHTPVEQTKTKTTVTWKFPDDPEYVTEKKEYIFDIEAFDKEFKQLEEDVLNLYNEHIFNITLYESRYIQADRISEFPLISVTDPTELFKWYASRYEADQHLFDALTAKFPAEMKKTYKFKYGKVISEFTYTFMEVICKLLNQYPDRGYERFFIAKCVVCANYIVTKDKLLNQLITRSFAKKDFTAFEVLEYTMQPKIKAKNFNLAKLEIIEVIE